MLGKALAVTALLIALGTVGAIVWAIGALSHG
jgi:hypothetical protein